MIYFNIYKDDGGDYTEGMKSWRMKERMKAVNMLVRASFVIIAVMLSNVSARAEQIRITKFCLDPGHGGGDRGVVGPSGLFEKDIVLQLAKSVEEKLSGYPMIGIFLSRGTDADMDSLARLRLFESNQANYVIAIHTDASLDTSLTGITIYYPDRFVSPLLSEEMARHLVARSGTLAKRIFEGMSRTSTSFEVHRPESADLRIYREATMPSVMINVGFLTNLSDEILLATPEVIDEVSNGIIQAIIEQAEEDRVYGEP